VGLAGSGADHAGSAMTAISEPAMWVNSVRRVSMWPSFGWVEDTHVN